jgi:transcriptional regulator with XRE-family HTH domain
MATTAAPPPAPHPGVLGRLFRQAREERGWARRDAAAHTGLPGGYLQLVEGGGRIPALRNLTTLARVFALPPGRMLLLGFLEQAHALARASLPAASPLLRAPGYRLELRRPDGTLVSSQDLATGAIALDLRPGEETLAMDETDCAAEMAG